MRLSCTYLAAAGLLLATSGVALAQSIENNQEVRVNPLPARLGRTLLYPGEEYSRNQPQLLYPGERSGPISLHMPTPRSARRSAPRTQSASAAPEREVAPAPPPPPKRVASAPPPPKPAPAPKPASKPAPAPAPQTTAPNIFNGPDYSNVFGNAAPQPPQQSQPQPQAPSQPQRQASAAPPPVRTAPPPVRTAPAGPTTGNETLTKRSMILFAKDATDPAAGALGSIKFLAGDLNAAMSSPNARIELQAFGGTKGDKGSDARRLSLKRALAIRQVLIDDGVSPDRIDVRAMGGVDDTGPADRVDVYTKA
jgi:outer membrane protein OmpA-like peptidoglycan-associated protein